MIGRLANLLRRLADALALLADACHRAAERVQPSVTPTLPDVELIEALTREALDEHNRQVARALYGPGLRVVR